MYPRLLAAVFAVCSIAMGQSLSVDKLVVFLQSSEKMIKEGKMTDRELASYLSKVKLTERLDDRTIENIQGMVPLGPKTLEALHTLRDHSQALAEAKIYAPPPKPVPIPPPSSEEQAAIITEVREYALNYSKTLPDFICTQVTRRFAAPAPGTKYGGRRGQRSELVCARHAHHQAQLFRTEGRLQADPGEQLRRLRRTTKRWAARLPPATSAA